MNRDSTRSARRRPENRSRSDRRQRGARRGHPGCDGGGRQRCHAGRKGGIKTSGDRVDTSSRCLRVSKLIVDLDELDLGELFETQHQRTRDVVKCPVRLTTASQIDMDNAIRKLNSAITGKTVADHCKTLVAFHTAGPPEEFIEHRIDNVF